MNEHQKAWTKHWGRASALGLEMACVDAASYTSPDRFEAEREKIFRKVWMPIARDEEVADPGQFIVREVPALGLEAVIVRGRDGVIRAFHNSCPHRGVALVRKCGGRTSLFSCPYHAWSFGTDGRLKAIPGADNFPQVKGADVGLSSIHCDVWNGFIFLNFDESPVPSLPDYLADFADLFASLPFDSYPYFVEMVQDVETNWKCFMDAASEGYHVTVLHKDSLGAQTTATENPLNHFYDPIISGPHASSTVQANPAWCPDKQPVVRFVGEASSYQVQPGGEIDGVAGRRTFAEHPAINRIGLPSFAVQNLRLFPFTSLQMAVDRFLWFQFWPLFVNRTRFVWRLYSPCPPSSYREAFAEAHMIAYSRDIGTEDVAITTMQNIGLRCGALRTIYLGENEFMLRSFHEAVRHYLQH
jgi:phenylpropionate dioxygenase-like ring-hydroxylating dioxygenase large terminal subunit